MLVRLAINEGEETAEHLLFVIQNWLTCSIRLMGYMLYRTRWHLFFHRVIVLFGFIYSQYGKYFLPLKKYCFHVFLNREGCRIKINLKLFFVLLWICYVMSLHTLMLDWCMWKELNFYPITLLICLQRVLCVHDILLLGISIKFSKYMTLVTLFVHLAEFFTRYPYFLFPWTLTSQPVHNTLSFICTWCLLSGSVGAVGCLPVNAAKIFSWWWLSSEVIACSEGMNILAVSKSFTHFSSPPWSQQHEQLCTTFQCQ